MTRFRQRVALLQKRLATSDPIYCPACESRQIEIVTVRAGEEEPPWPVCAACGGGGGRPGRIVRMTVFEPPDSAGAALPHRDPPRPTT